MTTGGLTAGSGLLQQAACQGAANESLQLQRKELQEVGGKTSLQASDLRSLLMMCKLTWHPQRLGRRVGWLTKAWAMDCGDVWTTEHATCT